LNELNLKTTVVNSSSAFLLALCVGSNVLTDFSKAAPRLNYKLLAVHNFRNYTDAFAHSKSRSSPSRSVAVNQQTATYMRHESNCRRKAKHPFVLMRVGYVCYSRTSPIAPLLFLRRFLCLLVGTTPAATKVHMLCLCIIRDCCSFL
jgi:hypothetical protein